MYKKNKIQKNLFNITKHGLISGIYFNNILNNICNLIKNNKKIKVLDFGCGHGYLKKKLQKNKKITVINFDIVKELSEIDDWRKVKFDYFVANQVFVYFKKKDLNKILKDLKKKNTKVKVILTISKHGWLNKLGAFILNETEAHTNFNLTPSQELGAFTKYMKIIKKKNIFFLADIYLLEFR